MIVDPDRYLENFREAGANILTVHYEACIHLNRTINAIRELGMKPAVCLNPHTPVSVLEEILPELYMVLLMSVNPGFGGQKFIPSAIEKIQKVRGILDRHYKPVRLQVDGGVNLDNIQDLKEAGADTFVAGSAIFNSEDYKITIDKMRELL